MASGDLNVFRAGAQLPTVWQTAVDLANNPNAVMRDHRELELLDVMEPLQGTGTFVRSQPLERAGSFFFRIEDTLTRPEEVTKWNSQ